MALVVKSRNVCQTVLTNYSLVAKRIASTQGQNAVFLEKTVEDPVLVIAEEDNVDIIGPPDTVSNLRPIIRKRVLNESLLQQRLREMQNDTQVWNQTFWAEHNTKFVKERQDYINSHQTTGENRTLNAEEMSGFYKSFLDRNWDTHVRYNIEWYRKNFRLLFLALRVDIERQLAKIL